MGVLPWGGGGGQTGQNVANRANFSPFLDFCPNVVTLAQKKLFPPYFGRAESKKKGLEHGVTVARLCRGPKSGHLPVFCLFSACGKHGKTPHPQISIVAIMSGFFAFGLCTPPILDMPDSEKACLRAQRHNGKG